MNVPASGSPAEPAAATGQNPPPAQPTQQPAHQQPPAQPHPQPPRQPPPEPHPAQPPQPAQLTRQDALPLQQVEPTPQPVSTFYEEIGGHPVFAGIVRRFYAAVADDDILRPLYPESDLGPAEVRLRLFLEQYWGGPRTYSQQRGHPRLRMRHAPFVITVRERDAWLAAMRSALDGAGLTADQDRRLWSYLVMAADSLVNAVADRGTWKDDAP